MQLIDGIRPPTSRDRRAKYAIRDMPFLGERNRGPLRVKLRRTHAEHISSALPLIATGERTSRIGSLVPTADLTVTFATRSGRRDISATNSPLVASSCRTSQCSASTPSVTRTTSASIQFLGLPVPENRPWTNHVIVFSHDQARLVLQRQWRAPNQIEQAVAPRRAVLNVVR
jgi:hypothetical protein